MDNADAFVNAVLSKDEAARASYPSASVDDRLLDRETDFGNLLVFDPNPIDSDDDPTDENTLRDFATDNAQFLMNRLWCLPVERVDGVILASLPAPTTVLPRAKPIPKPKEPTKWEKFAASKRIVKKKKTNLVWDDAVREWIPRFGYKKALAETKKSWMMELKGNAPDNEDPYEKAAEEKREKSAKNDLQRLRNIARAKKIKIPAANSGVLPAGGSAGELSRAAALARTSTASLGKFQEKLSGKTEKNVKKETGKKRKFDPLVSSGEKEKSLKILETLAKKAPKLDVTKAVGKELSQQERQRQAEKKSKGGKKGQRKGSKGSKGRKSVGSKKR